MKTKQGFGQNAKFPVGTITIRTRHGRGGEQRKYIKTEEPNTWILNCQYVWISVNGAIHPGMSVHHKNRDKLDDSIDNLEIMSKSDHLAEHRPEFQEKAIKSFVDARKRLKWSTKSKTGKICGRHPKNCQCPIHSH